MEISMGTASIPSSAVRSFRQGYRIRMLTLSFCAICPHRQENNFYIQQHIGVVVNHAL